MKRRHATLIAGAVLMTPLLGTPGCGLELAALGAAASAASQGAAAFKRGKLVASWMGPFDVVVASGEAAFGDLGYRIVETAGDAEAGHWKIVAKDEQNDKITIFVNRQTSRLTEFEIDVTWFGRETTARLILKRMATAINLNADQDGTGDILPAAPAEIPNGPKPEE